MSLRLTKPRGWMSSRWAFGLPGLGKDMGDMKKALQPSSCTSWRSRVSWVCRLRRCARGCNGPMSRPELVSRAQAGQNLFDGTDYGLVLSKWVALPSCFMLSWYNKAYKVSWVCRLRRCARGHNRPTSWPASLMAPMVYQSLSPSVQYCTESSRHFTCENTL